MRRKDRLAMLEKVIAGQMEAVAWLHEQAKAAGERLSAAGPECSDRVQLQWAASEANAAWFRGIEELHRFEWQKARIAHSARPYKRFLERASGYVVLLYALKYGLDATWQHSIVGAGLLWYLLFVLFVMSEATQAVLTYAMRAEAERIKTRMELRPMGEPEWSNFCKEHSRPHKEAADRLESFRAAQIVCQEALEKETWDVADLEERMNAHDASED